MGIVRVWVVAEAGLGAIALAPSDVSGGVIMPDKAMDDENRQCGDCTTPPTETDCTSHNTDECTSSSCEGPATEDACQETSTVDDLLDQLKKAEKEIEELNSRYLRALADYDNAKKRAKAEQESLRLAVVCDLVENLLPAIDNLDRAIESGECSDVQALVEGVKMVRSQIMDAIEAEGVKCIDAVGTQFDPNKHDAVMVTELEGYEDNVVVEEFQKGYEAHGRVIRPSMVKVNKVRD